jgi:hypothetical protein
MRHLTRKQVRVEHRLIKNQAVVDVQRRRAPTPMRSGVRP